MGCTMAELTFTKGRTWTIQWNTIYEGYSNLTYIGKWTREYYNDADYAAVAIEYDIQGVSNSIEPWIVTIPITFSSNYKGTNLYAALSTSAPSTRSPNWRYGPSGGVIGTEITFGYKTTSLEFNVRTLAWLGSNKVYLYLYDHNNGTSAAINCVAYSNADDASFEYNNAYSLAISEGQGSTIQVARQSSDLGPTGVLTNGHLIYTNDTLRIAATPNSNYRILTLTVNGNAFVSGNTHNVTGDVSVVSTAQVLSSDVGATDADIETTSTITIVRYDNSYVHTLEYSFGSLSGYITASGGTSTSREIITGTSVPFAVPVAFYAQIPNAQTGICTITCKTYANSTSTETLGDPTTCTFTARASASRCSPTVSGTVVDTNNATTALTGDPSKIVRYMSTAKCTIMAAARNSATLSELTINGRVLQNGATSIDLTGDELTNRSIRFTATDSRGLTTVLDAAVTLIPYVKLTCNPELKRNTPTDGNINLSITGKMYTGEWRNNTSNQLFIWYRYRVVGTTAFSDWVTVTGYVQQTDSYKLNATTLVRPSGEHGFDYRNAYEFQVKVTDGDGTIVCSEVIATATVQQGIPVFDWGKSDFRFNVPIYIGNTQLTEEQLQRLLTLLS